MTTRLLLIVCLIGCGACDRDDALVSRTIELGAFSQVEVLSDLEIMFVESDRAALEVRGPESGVEPVAAEVVAGVLRITTGEGGRWLSPKRARPTLTLYAPPLYRITLGDGARLSSGGPIESADFGVVFTGKLCEADLDLAGGTFYYWTSSFTGGRLTLRGETETLLLYNFGITGVEARGVVGTPGRGRQWLPGSGVDPGPGYAHLHDQRRG